MLTVIESNSGRNRKTNVEKLKFFLNDLKREIANADLHRGTRDDDFLFQNFFGEERSMNARTAAFCTGGRARVGVALKAFLLGPRN
jgi:hypothetical protein